MTTGYERYVAACEAENLDAHSEHMWEVHGRPDGPLGGCAHAEVRAFAADDHDQSWAHCSFCEADLTDAWWAGRDSMRHEYVLVPNQLGHIVQTFYRKVVTA